MIFLIYIIRSNTVRINDVTYPNILNRSNCFLRFFSTDRHYMTINIYIFFSSFIAANQKPMLNYTLYHWIVILYMHTHLNGGIVLNGRCSPRWTYARRRRFEVTGICQTLFVVVSVARRINAFVRVYIYTYTEFEISQRRDLLYKTVHTTLPTFNVVTHYFAVSLRCFRGSYFMSPALMLLTKTRKQIDSDR